MSGPGFPWPDFFSSQVGLPHAALNAQRFALTNQLSIITLAHECHVITFIQGCYSRHSRATTVSYSP